VETLMPRGPKGEKRPADVIGMSVKVIIATGEEDPSPRFPNRSSATVRG
jgi:hypothetical protein